MDEREREDRELDAMQAMIYRTLCQCTSGAAAGRGGDAAAGKAPLPKRTRSAPPGVPECSAAHPGGELEGAGGAWEGAPGNIPNDSDAPRGVGGGREAAPLPPRQLMAARLLLSGRGVTRVAAELGVTRHTVSRWMKDPRFDRAVRRMAVEVAVPPVAGPSGAGESFEED